MKKRISYLALMAGLALGVAQQAAMARDILVQGVNVLWTSLLPVPTENDTIAISDGGTLIVNADGVIGKVTIGNATSAGTLRFDATTRVLTVAGNIEFGANPANLLDMSSLVGTPEHRLSVRGSFLASGAGTFNVGLGMVDYYGTDQTVTARIAGSTINYGNLTLRNTGTKTLENGVTVQGTLAVHQGVTVAGAVPIIYGPLAGLQYVGNAATEMKTSGLEWPSSSSLTVRVSRFTAASPIFILRLDSDKTIGGSLIVDSSATELKCILETDGKALTVRGSVDNGGAITGSGRVILAGTSAQAITGTGTHGNLVVNNSAGATAPTTGLKVSGRLTISTGKLTLSGTASTAALLTLGTVAQNVSVPTTYGAPGSGATATSDAFAGTGTILVSPKPTATFTVSAVTNSYGAVSTKLSGKVTGGVAGNGAQIGDQVTITVTTGSTPLVRNATVSATDGYFEATFDTSTLLGGSYPVKYEYLGGLNLSPASQTLSAGLVVSKLKIVVTPQNKTKVYGTTDPPLDYSYSPALVGGDRFTGQLTRDQQGVQPPPSNGDSPSGEQVARYTIRQGTLALPTASYELEVAAGYYLEIVPMPVTVVALNASKTYGADDPPLTYTFSPPTLKFTDAFDGSLQRDKWDKVPEGQYAGQYAINQGTLTIKTKSGNSANYAISFTPAVFTINPLTTTIGLAAGSQSKTFGQDDPKRYSPTFNPPLAYTDVDDPDTTLARAPGQAAGNYAINRGTLRIIRGSGSTAVDVSANYNLVIPSTLNYVILKRDLRISAVTKQLDYGADITGLILYERRSLNPATPNVWEPWTDGAPSTPATVGNWSPKQPVVGTLPGEYTFEVLKTAADPNYNITYVPATGAVTGKVTIVKKALTVRADNQSKVQDGSPFPEAAYTSSANFVAGDTFSTAFTGGNVSYSGSAISAKLAGVYEITLSGTYTSDKYGPISYAPGSLVITKGIETVTQEGTVTWGRGDNYSWTINQANGGTAGASPGWKLLKVKKTSGGAGGILDITATETEKFTLYLSTLNPATSAAGPAAKFDPTRPYTWKIAEAEASINNFSANKFSIVYDGVGLFANKTFKGTFSVDASATELYLKFTPPPQTGTGSLTDAEVGDLLNTVLASDVDVLYLDADKYTITPQQPVTISLKVGNLRQPVFGAQAYLRFDSKYFVATQTGAGSPVVAPGGGVWDNVIFKLWNVGGDLDTVIGLSFSATLGTSEPGTVATITLTPNKTAVGKSRVIFRGDDQTQLGGISGGTYLTIGSGSAIRPARVQTKDIGIPDDTKAPVINSIAATQSQYGVPVNVKNGPATDPTSYRAVRGTVNLTVNVTDLPGVGLKGAPTVVLSREGSSDQVTLTSSTSGANDGDFRYDWAIGKDTGNGKWNAIVTATDNLNASSTATFYVTVNTREVVGIVELDSLRGSGRTVTFTAGNGSGTDPMKTWQYSLTTTDQKFLSAGEFPGLPTLASTLLSPAPTDATSTYLRYGTVANLASFVNRVLFGADNFASYMRDMWFGYFVASVAVDPAYPPNPRTFHNNVALALKTPTRSVDAYIRGRLSQTTINLLNAYPTDPTKVTAEQLAALETSLLNDFNTIVLGANIWDPLRFATVTPPVRVNGNTVDQILDRIEDDNPKNDPSAQEIITLNRLLLNGAYLPYIPGALNAVTAQGMLAYAGGSDATLTQNILADLDTIAAVSSKPLWQDGVSPEEKTLYTELRFLGIPLRKATSDAVLAVISGGTPTDDQTVQLNRALLEDGFASSGALNYMAGPLSAATISKLGAFKTSPNLANRNALEPLLVADFNKVLTAGTLTRAQFETTYANLITKYTSRGSYNLIDLPTGATLVAAKTAWNLRVRLTPVAVSGDANQFSANFVNGEKVEPDKYLKAGDIDNSNSVTLSDFTILQQVYLTTDPRADLNADGRVNVADYGLLQTNIGVNGDPAVTSP